MKPADITVRSLHTRRRGAILTMELVLVLPIFLALIFAIIEFTMLMSARATIGDVARYASRCMSVSGCSIEETESRVQRMLGPTLSKNASIHVDHGGYDGSAGNVRIDIPMQNAAPDLLWIAGFGLSGRVLSADAPMLMERDVASWGLQRL